MRARTLVVVVGAASVAVLGVAAAPSAWGTGVLVLPVPCAAGGAGLSAAIITADASTDPSEIRLDSGCTYLVTTEDDFPDGGGLAAVTGPVTIITRHGAAATIARPDTAPPFSLVNVDAGGVLNLTNVTVTGGLAVDGFVGGGVAVAAGASATLTRARVTGNTVRATERFLAEGGGIYSNGTVTLIDSRIDHNVARNNAADAIAVGAGIVNEEFGSALTATLVVESSMIDDNTATATVGTEPGAVGGGIATLGHAATTLIDSTIAANRVISAGPGSAALGAGLFDNLTFFTGFARTSSTLTGTTLLSNIGVSTGGFAAGAGLYAAAGDHSRIGTGSSVLGNIVRAPGGFADGGGLFEELPGLIRVSAADPITGNRPVNCDPTIACL